MVLLRHPLVFSRKGKEEAAIQSGPTLIEIKHGGAKKIEYTYTTKEGAEKNCAVYKAFKHKIPADMRNFIDKNSEVLEVIRVEDVYCKNKSSSSNLIPEMKEVCKPLPLTSKSTASRLTVGPRRKNHLSDRFLNIPNSSMISGNVSLNNSNNGSNSVSMRNSPVRDNSSFDGSSPISNQLNFNNDRIAESSIEEEKEGEPPKVDYRRESFESEDSCDEDDEEWNLSSHIDNERATIPIESRS